MADTTWNPGTRQEKAQHARTSALNTGNVTQEQHDIWSQLNGNNTYNYNNLNQDAKQQLVNYYNNPTQPVQPIEQQMQDPYAVPGIMQQINAQRDAQIALQQKLSEDTAKELEDNKQKESVKLTDLLDPWAIGFTNYSDYISSPEFQEDKASGKFNTDWMKNYSDIQQQLFEEQGIIPDYGLQHISEALEGNPEANYNLMSDVVLAALTSGVPGAGGWGTAAAKGTADIAKRGAEATKATIKGAQAERKLVRDAEEAFKNLEGKLTNEKNVGSNLPFRNPFRKQESKTMMLPTNEDIAINSGMMIPDEMWENPNIYDTITDRYGNNWSTIDRPYQEDFWAPSTQREEIPYDVPDYLNHFADVSEPAGYVDNPTVTGWFENYLNNTTKPKVNELTPEEIFMNDANLYGGLLTASTFTPLLLETIDSYYNGPDVVDPNEPWLPNGMANTPRNYAWYQEQLEAEARRHAEKITNGEDIYAGADSDTLQGIDATLGEYVAKPILEQNKNKQHGADYEYAGDVIKDIIDRANVYDYRDDNALGQRRINMRKGTSERKVNGIDEYSQALINSLSNDLYDENGDYLIDTRSAPEYMNQMDRFNYYITQTPEGQKWANEINPEWLHGGITNPEELQAAFTQWRTMIKDLTDANQTGSWDDGVDRLWTDIWNNDKEGNENILTRDATGKLDKKSRKETNDWMYRPANQFDLKEYLTNPESYSKTAQYNNLGKHANSILDFSKLMQMPGFDENGNKLGPGYGFRPYELDGKDLDELTSYLKLHDTNNQLGDDFHATNDIFDAGDMALYNLITLMENKAKFSDQDINDILKAAGSDRMVTSDTTIGKPVSINRDVLNLTPRGDKTWYTPEAFDENGNALYDENGKFNPIIFSQALDTIFANNKNLREIDPEKMEREKQRNITKDNYENYFESLGLENKDVSQLSPEEYYDLILAINQIGTVSPINGYF